MLFQDRRPAVANLGDFAGLGKQGVLVVIALPAASSVKLGKIVAASLSEVSPFLGNLAEFPECRSIGHQAAQAGRALAALGHDEGVQSTSTDASLTKPGSQKPVYD